MSSQVVTYRVDKSTVVGFEYDPRLVSVPRALRRSLVRYGRP